MLVVVPLVEGEAELTFLRSVEEDVSDAPLVVFPKVAIIAPCFL